MKLSEVYIIQFSGLPPGKHRFNWHLDSDFFRHFNKDEVMRADLSASVELDKHNSHMKLEFTVSGRVEVPCDHCGETCSVDIDAHNALIVRLAAETDLSGLEVVYLGPSEHLLDLRQWLYEFAWLAMPVRRTHEPGSCNPEADKYLIHEEPQREKDPRWELLNKLKN